MFCSIRELSLGVALGLWAAVAVSSAEEPIRLSSAVYQEQSFLAPDGSRKVRQVPASLLTAGSEVVYVVTYANVGTKPANIVITNPWPSDLAYRSATADLGNTLTEVSVDGGKSWGSLGQLMVATANGGQRRAHAGDVTAVRWKLAQTVRPGEQGKVSLRAIVR
jgi:uncharacterized repeat protein (TIGR01451 family)